MGQIIIKSEALSVGDVVALKVGGPDLVVVGFSPALPPSPPLIPSESPRALLGEATPDVKVMWFNAAGNIVKDTFPAMALALKAKAEPDKPS